MNQIQQLCSLAVDTQISVNKISKTTESHQNDIISEKNGKMMTSANQAKQYIIRKVLVGAF